MLKSLVPLFFIFLWILPVGWVGLMRSNYPLYPAWIAPLFRVTGVFESAPNRWIIFFIEVQTETGWHYVDERTFFASTPLGNRTRFQQLMNESKNFDSSGETSKLLHWIVQRLNQAGYPPAQTKAVRIVNFEIPSEMFLKCSSLTDVYKAAIAEKMPYIIVGSIPTAPSFDEQR